MDNSEDGMLLAVKNLSVTLGGVLILRDISFTVRVGETLAVIGPNGAGKTALFRALLGLVPSRGEIRWKKGVTIGYTPQRFVVEKQFPLSVKEFFLLKTNRFWRPEREFLEHIAHELALVGLKSSLLDKRMGELSGGELQRVLIAWAMTGHPDVLLLDEPAAGIDVGFAETVYTLLHQIQDELGVTVLLISHDINVVYRYARQVLCIDQKMICHGPPHEVLDPQELAKLYGGGAFFLHEKAVH